MLLFFNFIYRKYVWAIIKRFVPKYLYINKLHNTNTSKPLSISMITIYKDSKIINGTGIV
ncbi:unknown [Bacteroides sp. CAG:1060]|nr:unknown [Bacteroides sp. CAG:1060]